MTDPILRLLLTFRSRVVPLTFASVALLGATALQIGAPWVMSQVIDHAIADADLDLLYRYAALYAGIIVAQLGLQYASRVGTEFVAQGAMADLRARLFDHLLGHDLAYHDRNSPGRLISRVQGDTAALQVLFSEVVLTLPADVMLAIGMVAVLAASSVPVALLVAAVLPVWGVMLFVFRWWSPPLFMAQREVRAKLTGFLAEHVRALPMLRRYGRQVWVLTRADALNDEVQQREVAEGMATVYLFNALFLVRSVGFALVLWGGGWLVLRGHATVGVLVMAMGYQRQLFAPLMRLSHNVSTIERARAAAIRIVGILDDAPIITDPPVPVPWPATSGVRFEDVRFAYDEGPMVLHGVTLDVPAGHRLGIVGATGSGKSTIVQLLLRFRDPTEGSVKIGGVDLRAMAQADLRAHVGYVAQDVRLFPGTLVDNLGADAVAAERALREVGLDLPLDAPVARDGANLSRGERQLVLLARALAKDPQVLLLDEATSAIDPVTEARVQAAIERVLAGRTSIIVAHRLATVRTCDTILVLEQGRVVESGTHDALLRHPGVYAGLYLAQMGVMAPLHPTPTASSVTRA